ncbi:Rne/Rng family ribonuclease [Rhodomicrobium vannielii ATCC 17100]|uniref:Rne/Rng family ribonuclease n=1 Tax=Rhodomicrobium vannielii TaxID=1069 RepID=UPI001917D1F9|nr:ribonuclease E/G [Rhodomicrobium vannielii]MBJ7532922.1 Rne/Rng family ribonuclease [Rhodomicrobium vannielii ATCC 17100]
MANKMLIDATHPEETRVVVTRGNRVEEFDYESASRKQLRGNIYLAKVARIEPSLQAAFVNYGGNRHGFLAFAEIHPDYYQIPVAVREQLMKEEAADRQGRYRDAGESRPNRRSADRAPEAEGGTETCTEAGNGESHPDVAAAAGEAPSEDVRAEFAAAVDATPTDHADAGETAPEENTAGETGNGGAIALEAVLPPTLYEEFTAAIARGEEARDEIPSHPDDVDGGPDSEDDEADEDDDELEDDSDDARDEDDDDDEVEDAADKQPRAKHRSRDDDAGDDDSGSASDDGGIISVPESATPAPVEVVGSEDALEELPQRHKRRWRHYKIQEVIKRNQIVLIQVVKEERGSKGAALTTYLSLAGRYTVLMPNTASGGGISRKITVPADRKRLKEIAQELDVPEGMGLIIRTAGASRTKAEIKRDFEYLLRLWENVRDLTLKSTAPCLVYEEGDLIKRSIRDLYNKDIDEILVAGEEAHHEAKEFMRMLMPSHAKNVLLYKEPEPIFTKYEVERQLNQMFSPVVTLKSGGYIVLNQTEALVAIDVNSGRSTREYSIEDTALKTNMEAAEEVARQVRLRDLAGLIVIDFIDMDERRNNRSVERKLKESLRHDRARIQVGHISHFGLLEMSRQRLRQGVVEVSTVPCPVCQGVGHIRSTESVALMILRSIEDHLRTQGAANITLTASTEAALYILNNKRSYLRDIELRYGVTIVLQPDDKAHGAHFVLERGAEAVPPIVGDSRVVHMETASLAQTDEEEEAEPGSSPAAPVSAEGEGEKRTSRRKRRRRRGRGDAAADAPLPNGHAVSMAEGSDDDDDDDDDTDGADEGVTEVGAQAAAVANGENSQESVEGRQEGQFRRNRRRGRRGGRRHREDFAGQPGEIPGLGEQPEIDFEHGLPVVPSPAAEAVTAEAHADTAPQLEQSVEVAPVETSTAVEAEPQLVQAVGEDAMADAASSAPVQSEAVAELAAEVASEPAAEAEAKPEALAPEADAPQSPNADAAETVEAKPDEPAEEQVKVEAEIAILPPLAPEPKPKPVRSGPPKKGWWQRSVS